ncbi:MAG: hypothetical protein QXR73_01665 [Candidatus Micrarchaeaceae archaeon]
MANKRKAKSSYILYGAIIGFVAGFIVAFVAFHIGVSAGAATHGVNVTAVRIIYLNTHTGKSYLGGVLQGFNTSLSSPFTYDFTLLYANSSVNETVYNMTTFGNGFSIIKVLPQLPVVVHTLSNVTFSLNIMAPNATYSGPLNITVLYVTGGNTP